MKSAAKGMLVAIGTLALTAGPAHAQGEEPAGGAALGEIAIATTAATLLTVALLRLGSGHRSGRTMVLSRAAAFAHRQSGLPGWAALPSAIAGVVAAVGRVRHVLGHLAAHRRRARRRARWPTPPTTSSSRGCSASSPRA